MPPSILCRYPPPLSPMPEIDNPWVFFIEEQESRFSQKPPPSIKGEDTFRTAIEGLCKKHKEPRPQRLLSGLCSSYATINDFAEVIARAQGLPPDSISGLIWGASIVVIRVRTLSPTCCMPSTNAITVRVFRWNKPYGRCEAGGPI